MNLTKATVEIRYPDDSGVQFAVRIDSQSEPPLTIVSNGGEIDVPKEQIGWLRQAIYDAYYAVYGETPK